MPGAEPGENIGRHTDAVWYVKTFNLYLPRVLHQENPKSAKLGQDPMDFSVGHSQPIQVALLVCLNDFGDLVKKNLFFQQKPRFNGLTGG